MLCGSHSELCSTAHPHHTLYSTAPPKHHQNILSLWSPEATAHSCFGVTPGLKHLVADHQAVLSPLCEPSAGSSVAEG